MELDVEHVQKVYTDEINNILVFTPSFIIIYTFLNNNLKD